ncbi:DoxX family protein [Algoriphagus marinus]|uniref:DoxX family protein n=1 Tax=Algoriphagus marinus TaxID=1925762 RepID=UPI00094BAB44|nr:DoxX family protein [Algoriphagus marinus]
MKKQLLLKIGKYLMAAFYFLGGINHFLQPEFYLPLIPEYLPEKDLLNTIAGIAEVVGAIGLLIPQTRKIAAWGIVAMLVAFIPSHVYFIQIGSCLEEGLCVSEWIGWIRLVLIHPLLIWWAFIYTK